MSTTRKPDSYGTTISLGRGLTHFDVILYYDYELADPGVRYYPDGNGCPPSPSQIMIYDVDITSIWFLFGEDGNDTKVDRQWLVDRGWFDMVRDLLLKHIAENYGWYSDEISYDIDTRDNEPDHPDDWDDFLKYRLDF